MPPPARFVLHDHRRPSPHFDLRLEEGGVLRSWAVPKGLPDDPAHDRLAIAVDDHELDHIDFEDEHSRSPTPGPDRSTTGTSDGWCSRCTGATPYVASP